MTKELEYTDEMADKICELVATHACGLIKILKMYPELGLPCEPVIYKWRHKYPEFAAKYAEAKRRQADLLAEQTIDIADDGTNDTYIDENGKQVTNYDHIARSRLRVDVRRWLSSKLLPKVYGNLSNDAEKKDNNELFDKLIDKLTEK